MNDTSSTHREIDDLWIVVPVLNDWESCQKLAFDLEVALLALAPSTIITLLIADDGSSTSLEDEIHRFRSLTRIRVWTTRTESTSGHQASIARALRGLANDLGPASLVVVMDGDGEDSPRDVARLVKCWREGSSGVVTAQRGKRSESAMFRIFYRIYRIVFRLLTGEVLANGNFMVLSERSVRQIIDRPSLGVHIAATVARYGGSRESIVCDRAHRYAGSSRMNRRSLMLHGFAAVSTYGDLVALRIAVSAFCLLVTSVVGLGLTTLIRLTTDWAIPGWATTVTLGFFLVAIQSLIVALTALVLFISTRSTAHSRASDGRLPEGATR